MPDGGLSLVPGSPTFRSASCNAVAVVPLLSSGSANCVHTQQSYNDVFDALCRYRRQQQQDQQQQGKGVSDTADVNDNVNNLLLVVPNSNLSKPGDWRYDQTPLKHFSFNHGCLRLQVFDGRPDKSRMAHDRLLNHPLREYADLEPSRRTAAVVGVLNVRDCPDVATLKRAELELERWAERYATPPYSVTAHGRNYERDLVVKRLYVFDSFHESNVIKDLAQSATLATGSSLVAFPPAEMLDLHISNVVLNDLAVAIFRSLELKIKQSDALTEGADGAPNAANKSRFFGAGALSSSSSTSTSTNKGSGGGGGEELDSPQGSSDGPMSINNLASVVSPNSKLAPATKKDETTKKRSISIVSRLQNVKGASSEAQLLTPLDEFWDYSELSPKDAHEMMKREVARREKYAADLSLLAGSPLDAYERYTKAADLCKTACPDPLWYASAVEGIASAHVAMAECGGFEVDNYLEASFQLPDDLMACAVLPAQAVNKQNMPSVIAALCEDALDITSRHPKLACFHAELLLKLSWYVAEVEDVHLRCQWGLGEGCYGGEEADRSSSALGGGGGGGADDINSGKRRWEMASATQLNFLDWKNKDGEDVINHNTLKRCQKWTEYMHAAVSTGALDAVTRGDVALRCVSLCLRGLRPTVKPTERQRCEERVSFLRKAAFFSCVAAEAISEIERDIPDERAAALWIHASKILSPAANSFVSGNYGWATLRAVALHSLVLQGVREVSEEAAINLLSLLSAIAPLNGPGENGMLSLDALHASNRRNDGDAMDASGRDSEDYADTATYIADARSYVRERAKEISKDARARSKGLFSSQNTPSSLLAVAQSKWVDDDPIDAALVPMSDFSSDFSNRILALKAVWSTIKLDNCTLAQKRLLGQISDLRKKIPAFSLPSRKKSLSFSKLSKLPVKVISIEIVGPPSPAALKRSTRKGTTASKENTNSAMATFFNPYAKKNKQETKTILVPVGEEQYILVTFQNKLSIPLEIASCRLEFSTHSDTIKAPAVSFVIPGHGDNFSVQFPFLLLQNPKADDAMLTIAGIHVTALSRSRYFDIGERSEESSIVTEYDDDSDTPPAASLYPRRNYSDGSKENGRISIRTPRMEIVPPQPSLQISFARANTPIKEDMIVPVPLMDGEIFLLPKLCLYNDPGISELGTIEDLKITAHGLPGYAEMLLYELSTSSDSQTGECQTKLPQGTKYPISLTAVCNGMDKETINSASKNSQSSFISLCLTAAPDMGAMTAGCTVTLRFRYRGQAPSDVMEVWRSREIELGVLRMKGPRISSLAFRPDLWWESGYTELCKAIAAENDKEPYSSVDVCSKEVVVLVMVANEAQSPITISGFSSTAMEMLRIPANVSIRIPITMPRLQRGIDLLEQLTEKTRLTWEADIAGEDKTSDKEANTGGPTVALNHRKNLGFMEVPALCLQNIVDENPLFALRAWEAPCNISVFVADAAVVGIPVDVTVNVSLSQWLELDSTKATLQFCCTRKDAGTARDSMVPPSRPERRDFIWTGHTRKSVYHTNNNGPHLVRLIFLDKGVFYVSACIILDGKEAWFAEKAALVQVAPKLAPQ